MRNCITNLKPDFTERTDRAVSPVIGVILMVAITVILAAVLGTFVLGIGGDLEETPQASTTITGIDIDTSETDLRHQGGASLVANDTVVVVNVDGTEQARGSLYDVTGTASGDTFETGQTVTINESVDGPGLDIETGDMVEVLLIHDGSGETIASTQQRA